MPNFARIFLFLKNIRKGQPKKFDSSNEEELGALATLREKFVTPVVLNLPRSEGEYFVETDACAKQLVCVLVQEQEKGLNRPIENCSRTLTKSERAYDTTQRYYLSFLGTVNTQAILVSQSIHRQDG